MKVAFEIDIEKFSELHRYSEEDVNLICKQLFIDWYHERYEQGELHDRVCDIVKSSLIPTIQEMQDNYKELFGVSKISQKKGEIMENNIFELFRNHLQDYAITPTNHLPHNADAEVVTPSNVKLLLEVKNYTNAVDQKEINKLKYDMKETNIKHALFVSIKSGIGGKKMIDYELCEEGHIVYLSYVGDVTKIYCGLLLLETLSSNCLLEQDEKIEIKIKEGLEEMTQVLDMYRGMKERFMDMERNVKSQMDGFYLFMRDQETKIRNKINEVFGNMSKEIEDIQGLTIPKDKHQLVLQRTFDVLQENNIQINQKEDTLWELCKEEVIVGEVKKRKVGVDVIWKKPSLELRMLNEEEHYKTLNSIINS
jgi:hypothetical protein